MRLPSAHDPKGTFGHIGPYRLLKPLGRGGMGRVFLAEQTTPVARRVAVKLIRKSLSGPEATARFAAERQAMARLSHPNIAQLFDTGTTEDGHPFFAMEHVPGTPVTTYCDRARLSVDERLRLFLDICAGVQHAHLKQILHRDLKPSNILVTEADGQAVVKVIDFGIAKALDGPLTGDSPMTGERVLGTPSHMSPEALAVAAGGPDPDTRTDVYALGVLLYELLTGAQPFEARGSSLSQLMRRIETEDPSRPSARVASLDGAKAHPVITSRRTDRSNLSRRLTGDLDWIVLKAMAKSRSERYLSCAGLAADIRRHLRHDPVEARPPSAGYRFGRWIRRHRGAAAAAALLLITLVAGVVARGAEAERARRAATAAELAFAQAESARRRTDVALAQAEAARDDAERTARFLIGMFRSANPAVNGGRALTALELLEKATEELHQSFADRPVFRARLMEDMAVIYGELGRFDTAAALTLDALALLRANVEEDHAEHQRANGSTALFDDRLDDSGTAASLPRKDT